MNISEQIVLAQPKYVDSKLGPYKSIEEAKSAIPRTQRFIGMTVVITDESGKNPQEYWYKENTDTLVLKENGTSGGIIDCGEY